MALVQFIEKYVYIRRKFWLNETPDQPFAWDMYNKTTSSWDTDTKKVVTTTVPYHDELYAGEEGREPFVYPTIILPLDELVDSYYIPRVSTSYGYIEGREGQFVKIKSDGLGWVYADYSGDTAGNDTNPIILVSARTTAPLKGQVNGKIDLEVKGGAPIPGQFFGVYLNGSPNGDPTNTATGKITLLRPPGKYKVKIMEAYADPGEPNAFIEIELTIKEYAAIKGCMNPDATNYNADATEDDGTCKFEDPAQRRHFLMPLVNSLRFVNKVVADNVTTFEDFDNVAFCGHNFLGRFNPHYHQKFQFEDVVITQFRSNYETHTVKLYRHDTGTEVATIPVVKKIQYIGATRNYPAWIAADTDATKTRIYFNSTSIPLHFATADRITLVNIPDYAGTYTIQNILDDKALGAPYVLISKAYTGPERLDVTVQSTLDLLPYDVYEFTLSFAARSQNEYYVVVKANDSKYGSLTYTSEPIQLAKEHIGTHLIRYRNNDNAFEIAYSTGITHMRRITSDTFKQYNGGTRTLHRNPDSTLVKLQAMVWRMFTWETFKLPPWEHEILFVALEHDFIEIDGMRVQCSEGYQKPTYINRYTLADSLAEMEVIGVFGTGNGADTGDVDGVNGGYIIVNGGYLTRN
jgi:hypothetical protein